MGFRSVSLTKLCLCLVIVLSFLGSIQAQEVNRATEDRLSFSHPYLELSQFTRILSSKCGIPITVERSLASHKIAIFCEDLTANEVMARVADCLMLEWKSDGKRGLRLTQPSTIRREEADLVALEQDIVTSSAKAWLDKRIKLTDELPSELQREAAEIEDRHKRLLKAIDSTSKAERQSDDARLAELFSFLHNPQEWDDGYFARQFGSREWKALFNGETIFASTSSRPGMLRLEPEALKRLPLLFQPDQFGTFPNEVLSYMRFNLETGHLEINHRYLPNGAVQGGGADLQNDQKLDTAIQRQKLIKRLENWGSIEDSQVLKQTLSRGASNPVPGPYRVYTLAQNLQWLHERSGVPIVADSFRRYASSDKVTDAHTVGEWLTTFNQWRNGFSDSWNPAYVKAKSGWLMMRHGKYWRLQQREIVEEPIRNLEAHSDQGQNPSIDDYGSLADEVNPAQEGSISSVIAMISLEAMEGNVKMLQAWHSLSSSQREAAKTVGLSLFHLDSTQTAKVRTALEEALWTQIVPSNVLPAFLPGSKGFPEGLRLFYEDTTGPLRLSGSDKYTWMRMGESVTKRPIPFDGARFHIGFGVDSNIFWEVKTGPLRKKSAGNERDRMR